MVEGAGIWGPVVYIAIKALTFTFAPLSAGPIQFASGILFGVIPGTLYSVLGEVIGGAVNVHDRALSWAGRIVKRFVGDAALARIDDFYERHLDDWKSLLAARLLLFSVYDFISYAVGLGHIRLSVYIAVSFIGGLDPDLYLRRNRQRSGAESGRPARLSISPPPRSSSSGSSSAARSIACGQRCSPRSNQRDIYCEVAIPSALKQTPVRSVSEIVDCCNTM